MNKTYETNLLARNSMESARKDLLGWSEIIDLIAKQLHWDSSRQFLIETPFQTNIDTLEEIFDSLEYFLNDFEERSNLSQQLFDKIPQHLSAPKIFQKISKEQVPSIEELNFLCSMLESYRSNRKAWTKCPLASDFMIDNNLIQQIYQKFIDPFRCLCNEQGQKIYNIHPKMRPIWSKIQKIDQQIRLKMKNIKKDPLFKDTLQFEEFDVIDNKFVLAIRSDHYRAKLGAITGRSQSGMTLYVEPMMVKSENDERMHLQGQLEEIYFQLIRELLKYVFANLEEITRVFHFFTFIDILQAKSRYCYDLHLNRPQLNEEKLEVFGLFHPLIENPIPNDCSLEQSQKGIIISGPNTGGKTVFLKALALTQMHAQFGLFVPCSKAMIPIKQELYYIGEDLQNLREGLSSFSAEASEFLHLVRSIKNPPLIFIDEIFNSTASHEASALSIALLEELTFVHNAQVFVSTHHHKLKSYFHQKDDFVSAHMEFDRSFDRPTYKIRYGRPGQSFALEVFSKLLSAQFGPARIVSKAKNLLEKQADEYDQILSSIKEKEKELNQKIEEINLEKKKWEEEYREQQLKTKSLEQEKIQQFDKELDQNRRKIDSIINDLQNQSISPMLAEIKLKEVQKSVTNKSKEESINTSEINKDQSIPVDQLEVDQFYFCTQLNCNVLLKGINQRKNTGLVANKAMHCHVPLDTLLAKKGKNQAKKYQTRTELTSTPQHSDHAGLELDARGMRLEEFQREVESAYYRVLTGEVPFINIVHGHGTGVLKNYLFSFLKEHKDVKGEGLGGNQGTTQLILSEQ